MPNNINSTYFYQLLRAQIPKMQKNTVKACLSFFAFGIYVHKI